MSLKEWFNLNKRVMSLEKQFEMLRRENITLMTTPFIDVENDLLDGVVRGSELEETEAELDEETVEEREYREEQKWLNQRKQKERLV